jgi:hypothetical protein
MRHSALRAPTLKAPPQSSCTQPPNFRIVLKPPTAIFDPVRLAVVIAGRNLRITEVIVGRYHW